MVQRLSSDICIIGGGSGGLSVAAAAAAFGVETVLIEKGKMGGDCLNYGCVPSKALIAAGKHAHAIREAVHFGITSGDPDVDFKAVNAHVRRTIETIAPNDSAARFRALGVRVIEEAGRFVGRDTVVAGDYEIRARRFVIATGSSPFVPPIPGLDTVPYLTNETLFDLTKLPQHLIVVGGGPIGMEMAQAHRRLGSQVTVIEGMRALGKDDPELAAIVLERIRGEGVRILEGTKVVSVAKKGRGVSIACETADGPLTVEGTAILVATGRAANVSGLGLDEAGIAYERRGIKTGDNLRTSNKRVYAVGDVAGRLQFTHVAGYHAGLVIQQILFRAPAKEKGGIIPWATYTDPELAHVGLSEDEARKKAGRKLAVLRWPFAENDRAVAEGKTTGLVKVFADGKARILGVSIAGAGAGEMINFWALAVSSGLKLSDVRGYVPPYPTMGEAGKRAAVAYYAPVTRKPLVRAIVRFLRRFG